MLIAGSLHDESHGLPISVLLAAGLIRQPAAGSGDARFFRTPSAAPAGHRFACDGVMDC